MGELALKTQGNAQKTSAARKREALAGYLFVFPATLFFVSFLAYPLAHSLYLSLTKYNFIYSSIPKFIGLQNYVNMLSDDAFLTALRHTLQFTLLFLPPLLIIGLAIALLVQSKAIGGPVAQGLIFLPVMIPLSIAGVVFIWFYADSFGLLNFFLQSIGLGWLARPWLTYSQTALPAIAVVNLWKYLGLSVILFLAGLAAISAELYEAARLDGANTWQLLIHITLPNLKESLGLVTVWGLIESWKVFALPYVMTRGGPGDATQVLYLHIYETSFRFFEVGKAAAMAFLLAFIILVLSLVTIRLTRSEIQ
jgi:multiple sugar transport system permease protein